MKKRKLLSPHEKIGRLRDLAWRLRAIAYLIERSGSDPIPPLDEEEIQRATGKLLSGVSRRILNLADELDVSPRQKEAKRC